MIPPMRLVKQHQVDRVALDSLMSVMRNPAESAGDFSAQIAANRRGHTRLIELIARMGVEHYRAALDALNEYAEQLALAAFGDIPDGEYRFADVLDDDGLGHRDIRIEVDIAVNGSRVELDFIGSSEQVGGNVNCPLSVTAAAVYYVFRCLLPPQTPACAGGFRPITISAPEGCLLNARSPAAVAAGNVETSTRIVDVVLGALAQALPERIPAASHGSMNNVAMGSSGSDGVPAWDYYETIGGGMGAHAGGDGLDAVQTHMTNTLNTPIESLEMNFPLRIGRYQIRRGSGGAGQYNGGDGIIREFEFLAPAELTLLTERRANAPWGLYGGRAASPGANYLNEERIAAKISRRVGPGDVLRLETPGGGGWLK